MGHATRPAFALYRACTALAITVDELHVFLSSQPWNKKENVRLKGSESGKRCTRACTSHVASGVENCQVAPPFAEWAQDTVIVSPLRLE